MKRPLIQATLCVTSLVLGLGAAPAKKKAEKPVQERFEATFSPPLIQASSNVNVGIRELTTDQELLDLAQTFARGGKRALGNALSKVKKGDLSVADLEALPVEIIESRSAGNGRTLTIVAERGQANWGMQSSGSLDADYPYTCVQLEVDEQGNGKGIVIQFAKVTFNPQGRMVIENFGRQPFRLVNVHLQK